jgi:hypothetical protein
LGNGQCTDIPSEESHYAARELDLSNTQERQCTDLHLYQTESLTLSVCTYTRRKTSLYGMHLYKTEDFAVRVFTCTRRETSLYGHAHVQDGKPHCTGLQLYKTENLEYCVNNGKASCSYLITQKILYNEDISNGSFLFWYNVNISQAVQDSSTLKKSMSPSETSVVN